MQKQSSNTLKDYAKSRLLDEMVSAAKSNAVDQLGLFILIVDKISVKVLSSVCKMYDLITYRISTLEQIELKRKRFANSEAIYLLSPTEESINCIQEDFKILDSPQYKYIHLFFLGPIPQPLFDKLTTFQEIVPRVKTLKELNINFIIQEPEVFHFGFEPTLNMYINKDNADLEYAADKLFTVCSTFVEFPYIQYNGQSVLCKKLATLLQQRLNNMAAKAPKDLHPHEPKGTVIIVDRAFDINSPLMHDYCYEVMVYDYLKVRKDRAIDPDNLHHDLEVEEVKGIGGNIGGPAPKNKLMFLGENEPLWKVYRFLHILEVINKLSADSVEFSKQGKRLHNLSAETDLNKLEEIMAAMPTYKDTMESYKNHQNIIGEIAKNPDQYNKLIELEQGIISGVEPDGKELDNKKVSGMIGKILMDFKSLSSEELLRIHLMYLANYDVPKRDIETLAKSFSEEDRETLTNIVLLGYGNSSADIRKPQRREPKLSQDNFALFKERSAVSKGIQLRFLPKLARVAIEASQKQLSARDFPFAGEAPRDYGKKSSGISLKKGKSGIAIFGDEMSSGEIEGQPRLILYVIGGISRQETTTIFKLQQSKHINCPVTIGGDCMLTPHDFIKSLKVMAEIKPGKYQ